MMRYIPMIFMLLGGSTLMLGEFFYNGETLEFNTAIIGFGSIAVGFIFFGLSMRGSSKRHEKEMNFYRQDGKQIEVLLEDCEIESRSNSEMPTQRLILTVDIEGVETSVEGSDIVCSKERLLAAMKAQKNTYVYYNPDWGTFLDVRDLQKACNYMDLPFWKRIPRRWMHGV